MCCWIEVAGALNFQETTGDVSTFSSWSTEKLSGFSRSELLKLVTVLEVAALVATSLLWIRVFGFALEKLS